MQVAVPLETGTAPQPAIGLEPSENATVPELTVPELVTSAVSVVELFVPVVNDGLVEELSVVVVEVAFAVVRIRDQLVMLTSAILLLST